MNMANLPLSDHEFNLLVQTFRSPDSTNYVRWRDLCDTIDQVFTTKGLEKKGADFELT